MKRLAFISALFGIGAAKAQSIICGSSDPKVCTDLLKTKSHPKPANGECPVCGTMAEAYKPSRIVCDAPQQPPRIRNCYSEPFAAMSTSRRIDCAHCGCTFKQEAEHGSR